MVPPIEFEVAGIQYRADRLNAFKQAAIVRRLGKVVGAFTEALSQWQSGGGIKEPLTLLEPFMSALGEMRDEDVEFVLNTCLAQVSRQRQGVWARIAAPGGQLMFEDIEHSMTVMGRIVWSVLQGSLADFFTELLSALPAPVKEEALSGSGSPAGKTG